MEEKYIMDQLHSALQGQLHVNCAVVFHLRRNQGRVIMSSASQSRKDCNWRTGCKCTKDLPFVSWTGATNSELPNYSLLFCLGQCYPMQSTLYWLVRLGILLLWLTKWKHFSWPYKWDQVQFPTSHNHVKPKGTIPAFKTTHLMLLSWNANPRRMKLVKGCRDLAHVVAWRNHQWERQ